MKTSDRRPFLEIAPQTIIADAFWYRGKVKFSRGMSDSDTDHTLPFASSVVDPGQTSSRPNKLFRYPCATVPP
jgi:hypothetical protein